MTDLLITPTRQRTGEDREAPYYNPDEETKKRVAELKSKYRDKDLGKRAYEKTWFVNGAFIRGNHYVLFNDATRTFEVPFRVPPHRVRLIINLVLSHYRRTKARFTAHKPGLFVRPATTEQDDVERAKLGNKVLESELYRFGHFAKFKDEIGWMLECGSGLSYLSWNPWAGEALYEQRPKVDPETGEPMVDPQTGQPVTEQVPLTDEHGRHLREGQNEFEVVSPYEIDCDPNATTLDDADWIMRSKVRSITWIRENYPEMGKYVKGGEVYVHEFYQNRLRRLVGMFGYSSEQDSGGTSKSLMENDSAVVHEYWERPTLKHPEGQLIVIAGDVELHNGPNPYDHKLFPFLKTDEIRITGRFWGMATVEQLIPLQKNLNRARSQEVENRTLVGRPKWLIPRGAKVRQTAFDSEAGEKIDYNPGPRGERPELLAPATTTSATQTEIQHTMNDFQEVAMAHESFRGIMPSANAPAAAVERLQSADETAMGDTATNIDESRIRLGRMVLSNCAQFWKEERLVRVGGESARVEAMRVSGADLVGTATSADYFDVQMIPQSTLLRDPAREREKVQGFIDLGVLDPVVHRDVILKMLHAGDTAQAFEDDQLDEQWAAKENELMEQGTFSVPRDFENHDIHLKVLDRFRKSERYRRLAPEVQQLFDVHAQGHKEMLVAVASEKALMQAQVQGAAMPTEEGVPAGDGQEPASQPADDRKGQQ